MKWDTLPTYRNYHEEENQVTFPRHEASMHITHNQHKADYESIQEYLDGMKHLEVLFENDEAKQKCIETDSIWELQWYPRTPISFYICMAPTFEEVLKLANKIEEKDKE